MEDREVVELLRLVAKGASADREELSKKLVQNQGERDTSVRNSRRLLEQYDRMTLELYYIIKGLRKRHRKAKTKREKEAYKRLHNWLLDARGESGMGADYGPID